MARYSIEDATLSGIADSIRSKTGKTSTIVVENMAAQIDSIKTQGVMQNKTVTPSTSKQTVTADNGYDGLDTVTVNAMPTATQATPSITINASGVITATATQTAGYVSAGTKTSTHQLAFQAAKTITPSTASQVAVSSGYYTGGDVTVKGDSNLIAGNIKSGVSIFGISGTYEGSGGNTSLEDSFVNKTITNYTNDRITAIASYAFCYYSKLTTISFPVATSIGSYAFQYCSSLTTISFPEVTNINTCAFQSCYKLTTANFPVATKIYRSVFYNCYKLTTANFPVATSVGSDAFYNCSSLATVSFPVATSIGSYAFYNCSSLATVYFPSVIKISSAAFYNCYQLATASFPAVTSIMGSVFNRCYNLKSLYLTGSSVCALTISGAFSSTPIGGYSTSAGTYGSIYVPTSLLTSYQTATNWAYFSSRFVGI